MYRQMLIRFLPVHFQRAGSLVLLAGLLVSCGGGGGGASLGSQPIPELVQQVLLKASVNHEQDNFGYSVAVSGNTVVIGTPFEDTTNTDAGMVYVFIRNGLTWSLQQELQPSTIRSGDQFGSSVAISGDTIAVGAIGDARHTTGINDFTNVFAASGSGAVYIYTRTGTTWSQQAYIKASNTHIAALGQADQFGFSVSISGDTLAVGAPYENSDGTGVGADETNSGATDSGAVYVFSRTVNTWTQEEYIKAEEVDANDLFGFSVSVSGDTLAIGAPFEDGDTNSDLISQNDGLGNSGVIYVYTRSGSDWSPEAYVKASNANFDNEFGASVSLSGNTLAAGAPGEESASTGINESEAQNPAGDPRYGAAYIFTRTGTDWDQQAYVKSSNTSALDKFGSSIALSGDLLAVGATGEDGASSGINTTRIDGMTSNNGAVYFYTRDDEEWEFNAYIKQSNNDDDGDWFGRSIALTNTILVAGAHLEDSNGTGAGSIGDNELSQNSGAAYVFTYE